MKALPEYPALYQINTRVLLQERSQRLGRPATLCDLDDGFLDQLVAWGVDWLWPLGVWQTGPAGRAESRRLPAWREEYAALLPDLTEEDITGSPFAVQEYTVHADFGGNGALAELRGRLKKRGIRLLLDFVPNHTAPDHPWVYEHPEYYIGGDEGDLEREPHNYRRVGTRLGPRVLAHGRDPYFPGWSDTLQLNYCCLGLRQAMCEQLTRIAGVCDGVRCDMAMLLLPEVIDRTWGAKAQPLDGTPRVNASFWLEAIPKVRLAHPRFTFMAEVYWDLEWTLQQQGFDYTYDKRLYDRLHAREPEAVRGHLCADGEFQRRSVRFLENHDEPRAAAAFPEDVHRAAAMIAFFVPGMRFFHEGQFEGRRARVPMHLGRRPPERLDVGLQGFYDQLLECLKSPVVRDGRWQLLDCQPAWEGNATHRQFLAFAWDGGNGERLLVAVNYGAGQGQCYVRLPWNDLAVRNWTLRDRLGPASYDRDGGDLAERGLYLDLAGWQYHAFETTPE